MSRILLPLAPVFRLRSSRLFQARQLWTWPWTRQEPKFQEIVSSFICTAPESPAGSTFALFKRSPGRSVHPGKWAVCSGKPEGGEDLERAAEREILEETGLESEDITLLLTGKPFGLSAGGYQRSTDFWVIHPYAWQLKPNAKPIVIDPEHTEYKFVKSDDLKHYDHVPDLETGLKHLFPSPETQQALYRLNVYPAIGTASMATKALELLGDLAQGEEMSRITNFNDFRNELFMRVWHLATNNGRQDLSIHIEKELLGVLGRIEELDTVSSYFMNDSFRTVDSDTPTVGQLRMQISSCITARLKENGCVFPDRLEKDPNRPREDMERREKS